MAQLLDDAEAAGCDELILVPATADLRWPRGESPHAEVDPGQPLLPSARDRRPARPCARRAPTPFTAAAIRAGARSGRRSRDRRVAPDGSPSGEPEIDRVTWLDLQGHASFPADDTTIESERIETPLGDLDCLRYTVRDGESEKVLWFAQDLPGMPVRFLTRTDGKVVMTVSVVESTVRDSHGVT